MMDMTSPAKHIALYSSRKDFYDNPVYAQYAEGWSFPQYSSDAPRGEDFWTKDACQADFTITRCLSFQQLTGSSLNTAQTPLIAYDQNTGKVFVIANACDSATAKQIASALKFI